MLRRATALYMRTGTFSSPKLIVPLQIALAIADHLPGFFQPNAGGSIERSTAGAILRTAAEWDDPPVLFELREVGLDRGGKTVLDSLSAGIPEGATAIVGPSGAGKSTLLRLLNRLADPDRGEIDYRGRPLRSYEPLALRHEVALVPQLPALLDGTVESNLRYAADLAGEELDAARTLALAGLDPSFAERDVAKLSVGEQQRAMLARALAQRPRVLLLDEPTSALDHAARDKIEAALRELRRELEISIVLVSHDPEQARRLGDWVLRLEAGRLVGCGPLAEVLA
jgi:putative ABC transport system ATP-binding protein